MLSDFKDLFGAYCAEGLVDSYISAEDIVQDFELDDLMDDLTELNMSVQLFDQLTVADMIHAKITDRLNKLLSDHSIFLHDEVTVSELVTVAECLRCLKNWDSGDDILSILEQQDVSEEERFAECCALVGDFPPETYLALFDSIGQEVLDRLKALYTPDIIDSEPLSDEILAYLPTVRKLWDFFVSKSGFNPATLRAFQLLKAGMHPGAPFRYYYDLIAHHFKGADETKHTAADLLALLYISDDTHKDVTSGWSQQSDYVFDNVGDIASVSKQLFELNTQYLTWVAANPTAKA